MLQNFATVGMNPFSPTAIALGPSAIVKVSGQNCFRSLCFSGADPSWAATRFGLKRFRGRFTKVPPRFFKFRYLSGLLGQMVLGCQKVPRKVSPRFRQDSTNVPARVHQGSTKVLQVSWCLWFSGADPSWAAARFGLKRLRGRFHQGSAKVSRRF